MSITTMKESGTSVVEPGLSRHLTLGNHNQAPHSQASYSQVVRPDRPEDVSRFFRYRAKPLDHPLCITGMGRLTAQGQTPYPSHPYFASQNSYGRIGQVLPDFQVILITNGSGEFESKATGRMIIEAPTVITLPPNTWHRYQPLSPFGWTERWLSFDGKLAHTMFDLQQGRPSSHVTPLASAELLATEFDSLLQAIESEPQADSQAVTLQALRILVEVANFQMEHSRQETPAYDMHPQTSEIDDPIVAQALRYIWSDDHGPISVSDVAHQLPVTRRTLDRRFSEALGHSVLEEIVNCRMTRAKQLLTSSDMPVKRIAELAGFPSPERMRVTFVESEGMPPHAYRQRHAVGG